MRATYFRLMDVLHRICMLIAAICLVAITLIIPWSVFTRYVLQSAASWPEPMAVLLMIWFAFTAAALCYREKLHITVNILPRIVHGPAARVLAWIAEILMGSANLFVLIYGVRLVQTTWHQVIAEFPVVSTGVSYLPIPLGGGIIVLFVIEQLLRGPRFTEPMAELRSAAPIDERQA
ncbi:TRAP transporter small permease [Dongia deserti]|uniref:TRAP transporter small permease n=1 Tax=Dongia deserti TaxID=2268030 RepID=UPI000E64F7D0|nr:TRAP transporter small permease [Dongia deserti]